MRPMEEVDNCLKLKERKDLLFLIKITESQGLGGTSRDHVQTL